MGKASFQDFRQLLEQVDFVSFDVFDTLIHRRTASPKDVFLLMWANICADEQWQKSLTFAKVFQV